MHVYCAFCKAFSQVILAKPIDLVNLFDTPCSHFHVTILKVRSFLLVQPVQGAKPRGSNYVINLPSMEGILLPRFVFAIWRLAKQNWRCNAFKNSNCESIFWTCWHRGMIHIPCRYVGLTWSLSLIGHLYVSGVLQGSLVRRDTTLCFHVNVCHARSWGICSRDSIYSWATDLGKQPHVQGFYVSVYYICAWGGQIRGLPTCNVGFFMVKKQFNNILSFM